MKRIVHILTGITFCTLFLLFLTGCISGAVGPPSPKYETLMMVFSVVSFFFAIACAVVAMASSDRDTKTVGMAAGFLSLMTSLVLIA